MFAGTWKIYALAVLTVLFALTSGINCPVSAQDFSVGFGNREFTGKPGELFQGTLTITNRSDNTAAYTVSLRESGQANSDGEPIAKVRSLVSTMTFSPTQLMVGAGETGNVSYEVTLPDDPELEGSYWGSIVVVKAASGEEIAETVKNQGNDKNLGVGIKMVWEYVVLVYATVEGTQIREATFSDIRAETVDGKPNLIATFENLGNIQLRPNVMVEVNDITGQTVYREELQKTVFLPERKKEFSIPLTPANLAPGEYMVMVIADYGVPQMIAAQARITITEAMADEAADRVAAQAAAEAAAEAEANGDGAGEGEVEPDEA